MPKGWARIHATPLFEGVIACEVADLKVPKTSIKTLMKNIHQNAIKYLTYLVLNKRKLDNKQTTVAPP